MSRTKGSIYLILVSQVKNVYIVKISPHVLQIASLVETEPS